MKRLAAVLVICGVVVAVVLGVRSGAPTAYRVAAIFDTAKGMVAGQQVKVAGSVVGTVDAIDLDWTTTHPKARIVMSIDRRFAPFRQSASCTILPEGLISENYVECDPGSQGPPLAAGTGGVPTVPLPQTTIPFSLQDVLGVFSLPTDDRLRVLISELGIGTSGRGQDLAGILERADPALTKTQRVLTILDAQRRQIATAVGQTDDVLAHLAADGAQVRTFVDRAANVAETTAAHRAALARSIKALPAMLDSARPALRSLDTAAANASPLLDYLRASAPGLDSLTHTLPAFATAGLPALRSLAQTAKQGRPAVRDAVPVIAHLQTASGQLDPFSRQLDALLVSLRGTGGVESTMQLMYTLAVLTSSYDSTSHLINFIAQVAPQCLLGEAAGADVTGCSKKYSSPGQGTVPVNDPGCGPQPPQNFWDNASCPGALPAGVPTLEQPQIARLTNQVMSERALPSPQTRLQLGNLLQYLLK